LPEGPPPCLCRGGACPARASTRATSSKQARPSALPLQWAALPEGPPHCLCRGGACPARASTRATSKQTCTPIRIAFVGAGLCPKAHPHCLCTGGACPARASTRATSKQTSSPLRIAFAMGGFARRPIRIAFVRAGLAPPGRQHELHQSKQARPSASLKRADSSVLPYRIKSPASPQKSFT
jgi:hypothetical protein